MSKQTHNAFYYFMLDFQAQHGRKYKSLRDTAEAAGPHWKNLSKEKRSVYEQRAKSAKSAVKASKLNSDQKPVDEIEDMERQEMEWKQQMKDDIQATLTIARRANMLDSHSFFIIHMNSFCQHEHTKIYSPCEVAIAAFSLRDGVLNQNIYHAMIKPGPLPLGYAGISTQHSNETHQIELPKVGDEAEDNQEEVFNEIIEFLFSKRRVGSEKLPILYAAEKNLPMVTSVFQTWCERFQQNIDLFQIYNLQCMFRILRNTVAGTDCWPSDTMSYQEIEKDVYNYTEEIACEFHQMADVLVFCSRSIVVRYAFIICDNCCADAGIELVPGCHVPSNAKVTGYEKASTKSAKSSKKSSTKYTSDSSIRDDTSDAETVISIGRSAPWDETSSSSSITFPELNKNAVVNSQSAVPSDGLTPHNGATAVSGSGSYAGATSSRIGSSGFSRRPAALPFNAAEGLGAMSLSQESMDNHFPAIGSGRGRNLSNLVKGKGRGHPFMKSSSKP